MTKIPKYKVGEDVYFLNKNTLKIQKENVERLYYKESRGYSAPNYIEISYDFNSSDLGGYKENELFSTKEELLKSL